MTLDEFLEATTTRLPTVDELLSIDGDQEVRSHVAGLLQREPWKSQLASKSDDECFSLLIDNQCRSVVPA